MVVTLQSGQGASLVGAYPKYDAIAGGVHVSAPPRPMPAVVLQTSTLPMPDRPWRAHEVGRNIKWEPGMYGLVDPSLDKQVVGAWSARWMDHPEYDRPNQATPLTMKLY